MRKRKELKLYIIRKYIMAPSAKDALKKDKHAPVDDVWVDDDWKKMNVEAKASIGFNEARPK